MLVDWSLHKNKIEMAICGRFPFLKYQEVLLTDQLAWLGYETNTCLIAAGFLFLRPVLPAAEYKQRRSEELVVQILSQEQAL